MQPRSPAMQTHSSLLYADVLPFLTVITLKENWRTFAGTNWLLCWAQDNCFVECALAEEENEREREREREREWERDIDRRGRGFPRCLVLASPLSGIQWCWGKSTSSPCSVLLHALEPTIVVQKTFQGFHKGQVHLNNKKGIISRL